MRYFFFLLFACLLTVGCTKTSIHPAVLVNSNSWRLVQKDYAYIASGIHTTKPAYDSVVVLTLNPDNETYAALFNGDTTCQGSYTVTIDTSSNQQMLQLNNLATTGIFVPFITEEIAPDGGVVSSTDAMIMKRSTDTLILTTPASFDYYASYTFINIKK